MINGSSGDFMILQDANEFHAYSTHVSRFCLQDPPPSTQSEIIYTDEMLVILRMVEFQAECN